VGVGSPLRKRGPKEAGKHDPIEKEKTLTLTAAPFLWTKKALEPSERVIRSNGRTKKMLAPRLRETVGRGPSPF